MKVLNVGQRVRIFEDGYEMPGVLVDVTESDAVVAVRFHGPSNWEIINFENRKGEWRSSYDQAGGHGCYFMDVGA